MTPIALPRLTGLGTIVVLVGLAAIALTVGGCGDDDNVTTQNAASTAAVQGATTPSDGTSGQGTVGPGTTSRGGSEGPTPTTSGPPATVADETGILGQVTLRVCDPGDARGCDAPRQPLAAAIVITNRATGGEVARATSTDDGWFTVRVASGAYEVVARPTDASVTCAPIDVVVDSGTYAEVSVDCASR